MFHASFPLRKSVLSVFDRMTMKPGRADRECDKLPQKIIKILLPDI